jgi:hypothetical protein
MLQSNKNKILNYFFLEANPVIIPNFLVTTLFLQAFAGTSVGRSANSAKNSVLPKKIFPSFWAKKQKRKLSLY